MKRRDFLQHAAGLSLAGTAGWLDLSHLHAQGTPDPGFRFTDVTKSAGLTFTHNNGAYGGKLLPTLPSWLNDGTRPSTLAWYLKERILPPLYWDAMLKGREWLAQPEMLG